MKNPFILILIVSFFVSSCKKKEEVRETKGSEYFPMKVGTVLYYDVDSFFFDPFFNKTDTVSTVLKEEVMEKLVDLSNDTIYRIELSTYNKNSFRWIVFQSFYRKIKDNFAIEVKDNIPEVKLYFPISSYKTRGSTYAWNLNMFNQFEPKYIKYNRVFYNQSVNTVPYTNCVNVQLNRPISGIKNDYREEIYAKDIGLIYKHIDSSDYTTKNSKDSFTRSGKEIFLKLKR